MNILDKLPLQVKKEIRSKMETEFERYRLWKFVTFQERETQITASYEDRPSSPTNEISDPTTKAAVYNVDEQERRSKFVERVEMAVSYLPLREKQVIELRYMQREPVFDYTVYNHLLDHPISTGTYEKLKVRAMAKLALSLGVRVEGLERML